MVINCSTKIVVEEKKHIRSKTKILLAVFMPIVAMIITFIISILISLIVLKINTHKISKIKRQKIEQDIHREWGKILPAFEGYEKLSEKLLEINTINKNLFLSDQIEVFKCLEEASELSMFKMDEEHIEKSIRNMMKYNDKIVNSTIEKLVEELIISYTNRTENKSLEKQKIKEIVELVIPKNKENDLQEWRNLKNNIKSCISEKIKQEDRNKKDERIALRKKLKDLIENEMPENVKNDMKKWKEKWKEIKEKMKKYSIRVKPEYAEWILIQWRNFMKNTFKEEFTEKLKINFDPKAMKEKIKGKTNLFEHKYNETNSSYIDIDIECKWLNTISYGIFSYLANQIKVDEQNEVDENDIDGKTDNDTKLLSKEKWMISVTIVFNIFFAANISFLVIVLINQINCKRIIANLSTQLNIIQKSEKSQLIIKIVTIVFAGVLSIVVIILSVLTILLRRKINKIDYFYFVINLPF